MSDPRPATTAFALDNDSWITLGRRSARLGSKGRETDGELVLPRGMNVLLVRHTAVDPPPDAAHLKAGHFTEWFGWVLARKTRERMLVWHVAEPLGHTLTWRHVEDLVTEPGLPWARTDLPPALVHVTFTPKSSGEIEWTFTNGPSERNHRGAAARTRSRETPPSEVTDCGRPQRGDASA